MGSRNWSMLSSSNPSLQAKWLNWVNITSYLWCVYPAQWLQIWLPKEHYNINMKSRSPNAALQFASFLLSVVFRLVFTIVSWLGGQQIVKKVLLTFSWKYHWCWVSIAAAMLHEQSMENFQKKPFSHRPLLIFSGCVRRRSRRGDYDSVWTSWYWPPAARSANYWRYFSPSL